MVITSKYYGKCKVCGSKINKGERINWERGQGASHLDCNIDDPMKGYHPNESKGLTMSRFDKYGVYNHAGDKIGSTCNCEDYPCCGH